MDILCPLPSTETDRVLLAHGSGGRLMHQLLSRTVLPALGGAGLGQTDSAVLTIGAQKLAFTTDSFVVSPPFFAGGNIGSLAVCGTVNDLAMVGAKPLYLSLALLLEEGFAIAKLEEILASIRAEADAAGVTIVTGDTKVVDRGKGDGIFINTSGIGVIEHALTLAPASVRAGDAVIVSGDPGRHGIAVLAQRAGLAFETSIESDVACLHRAVEGLLAAGLELHCLRDLTRGGLASALVEIAADAGLGIALQEAAIPISPPVRAASELLGLDPLQIACEGRFVLFVPADQANSALACLRGQAHCRNATRIGTVLAAPGVTVETPLGTRRVLDMLSGSQLPRIC